jgi:hypothetical protein
LEAGNLQPRPIAKAIIRDYSKPLTTIQKKKIEYILLTLGNSSLMSLAGERSALRKAGTYIEAVHPLRFLSYTFSQERLKAAFLNMRTRMWVWSEFFDGLKATFDEEFLNDNIRDEHLQDFATSLNIEVTLIENLCAARRWKELIATLIEALPRDSNAFRYNM